MRVLEDMIDEQVSARDHLFVSLCPGLLVFRPLYHGRPFSHGVEAEIAHWVQLAKLSPGKGRAVFVHFENDVQEYVSNLPDDDRDSRDQAVTEGIIHAVELRTGLANVEATRLYRRVKAGQATSSTLREEFRAVDVANVIQMLPRIKRDAEEAWLNGILRGGPDVMSLPPQKPERVLVITAKDWADFRMSKLRRIARFLSVGTEGGWGPPRVTAQIAPRAKPPRSGQPRGVSTPPPAPAAPT
jgi:hypothetical protein